MLQKCNSRAQVKVGKKLPSPAGKVTSQASMKLSEVFYTSYVRGNPKLDRFENLCVPKTTYKSFIGVERNGYFLLYFFSVFIYSLAQHRFTNQ